MRLLTRTTLLITTISIFIFFIGSFVFFQITKRIIDKQINAELIATMHHLISNFNTARYQVTENIIIKPLIGEGEFAPIFKDTIRFNNLEKRYAHNRVLILNLHNSQGNFRVEIYKSMLESNALIESLTLASFVLAIVLIFSIYFANRVIFKSIWHDFFISLHKIENYDVKEFENMKFKDSEIIEFTRLNQVLNKMIERINRDFINLKNLIANTSHEIQTPLAIIRSKAELLLQSENLSKKQAELVSGVLNSSTRLSKLNESLLLISKIENNQFSGSESVNLAESLKLHVDNFMPLIESKNFEFRSDVMDGLIKINTQLLDILLINLLKNAIWHNIDHGFIKLDFKNFKLKVSNPGKELEFPVDKIFDRFTKGGKRNDSNGLGLSIVKMICDSYKIPVQYNFKDELHVFEIDFIFLKA